MANPTREDGYAVDIRLFLATLTVAMFASFLAGVGVTDYAPLSSSVNIDSHTVRDSFHQGGGVAVSEDTKKKIEQHQPAGQHLLVDIAGVDSDFLDSEDRLSKAMVETVNQSELTLLSYHCHSLKPKGVSCVGVLLESHISFHTVRLLGLILCFYHVWKEAAT